MGKGRAELPVKISLSSFIAVYHVLFQLTIKKLRHLATFSWVYVRPDSSEEERCQVTNWDLITIDATEVIVHCSAGDQSKQLWT